MIAVTGADGFIGRALCEHLVAAGIPLRRIVRAQPAPAAAASVPEGFAPGLTPNGRWQPAAPDDAFALGDLASASDAQLAAALHGVHAMVHLAGRAHVMRDNIANPAAAFHAANVVATERVAAAAVRAGVDRIILASTVKVHGESSLAGRPIMATDRLRGRDAYARSKIAAEHALVEICSDSPVTPTIIRLPLVYGPRVKGNFLSLMDAVARGARLPFGAIRNRRHLLYVGNLVHALTALLVSPIAEAGAWIAADAEALSTPELARRIGVALGVPARNFSVPVPMLKMAAIATGRASLIPRLIASFEVDASPLVQKMGSPPFSTDQGLAATAAWWRARHAI